MVSSNHTLQPLWHPKEVASYLGIHEKTVIRLARQKMIPALRPGKPWRFQATDLESWTADQIQSSGQSERAMEI